jgi:hypothetical protein
MQSGGSCEKSGRDSCINAPSQRTACAGFLAVKNIPVLTQPPHSPKLASSDSWLFPTLKMDLKGTSSSIMEDIKSNATAELRKIANEAFRR